MLTIHDRPFPAADRSEAGHWEGDLIIGDNHLSTIGTLVERKTRMVRLVHLLRSDADSLHTA
jgi:IS30 family transposase